MGDHVVDVAAGGAAHEVHERLAGFLPGVPARGVVRHRGKAAGPALVAPVHRFAAEGADALAALVGGDHADHGQPGLPRRAQAVEAGARGRALDEQAATRLDVQGREQGAVDRALGETVGAGLLDGERRQLLVQLRPLYHEELGVAAVVALVALDAEIRRHRVETLVRRQQLALPRIDGHQVAHGEATFAHQLLAELGDQGDAAGAGDLHIGVPGIER